jgi:uncharacterized membrane protein YphA (DoxX/SURF4 family)
LEVTGIAFRALLCLIFIVAAYAKLTSRQARADMVQAVLELLPVGRGVARSATRLGIALEIVAAILLLAPGAGNYGAVLAAVLLTSFTGVLVAGVVRGRRVQCRCFGMDGGTVGVSHIVRNIVLIGLAVAAALAPITSGSHSVHGTYVAVTIGSVLGWVFVRWDDVAYLMAALIPRPGLRRLLRAS